MREEGLEPSQPKLPDPKSGASTNSAIPAFVELYKQDHQASTNSGSL